MAKGEHLYAGDSIGYRVKAPDECSPSDLREPPAVCPSIYLPEGGYCAKATPRKRLPRPSIGTGNGTLTAGHGQAWAVCKQGQCDRPIPDSRIPYKTKRSPNPQGTTARESLERPTTNICISIYLPTYIPVPLSTYLSVDYLAVVEKDGYSQRVARRVHHVLKLGFLPAYIRPHPHPPESTYASPWVQHSPPQPPPPKRESARLHGTTARSESLPNVKSAKERGA